MKYYTLIITSCNTLICREFSTLNELILFEKNNPEMHIAKIIKGDEL